MDGEKELQEPSGPAQPRGGDAHDGEAQGPFWSNQANVDAVPSILAADSTIWPMWKKNLKPDKVLPESLGQLLENYGHEAVCRAVLSASYLQELWSLCCYQAWNRWYCPRHNSDASTVSFSRMGGNSCGAQHAEKKCWMGPSSSRLVLLDRSGNIFALFLLKLSPAYEHWAGSFTAMCWQRCWQISLGL